MAVYGGQRKMFALFANKLLTEKNAQDSAHADHYEAEDKTNDLRLIIMHRLAIFTQ
jgi:hypothetical protein